MTPTVSIVIPTWNGAATLPALLDGLRAQKTTLTWDILAVDSGSRDGTRELLAAAGVRTIVIPPGTFNHGMTRNEGIASCSGDLVALVVQDAVPGSDGWLDALVQPLLRDARVAGTWARQAPRADASPLTRRYLEDWQGCEPTPRVAEISGAKEFAALSPGERYLLCLFDNVSSCIRRSAWEQNPFVRTSIAEDVEWAQRVLLAGWRIAYVPEALVIHSHERTARYELWRTYLVHQRLRQLFGLATIPRFGALVRAIGACLAMHVRCAGTKRLWHSVALAFAYPVGQYLGARSADTGREYLHPRGV